MAFGDSITQGFDALHPSKRYVAKLSDFFSPDYILVAYGTNDWNTMREDPFKQNYESFLSVLEKKQPKAKIFAVTPLWRSVKEEPRAFGAFENVEKGIREAVQNIPNITLISGFDLIPKDVKFFADYGLHPNDEGFTHFANNLYAILEKAL